MIPSIIPYTPFAASRHLCTMIRIALLSCSILATCITLSAQENCTSHTISQRWLQQQGQNTDLLRAIGKLQKGTRKGGATPTIPVAVHVVWNTNSENVASSVIQNMVATMNEDYQALNSDFNNVRSAFASDRTNPDILFCLAQVDPNGNATTGITRTQTTDTWFDPDTETDDMKSPPKGISSWDPNRYLNIWICDISSGLGGGLITTGYAYLPFGNMVGSDIDGIVIDYNYGLASGSRTATHEVGHYLGLLHPWADGGCGSDDGMGDTPTTDQATFSCTNTNLMRCSQLTQYENFMDYADCSLMFTTEQGAQMNAILFGDRAQLLNNGACGTVNGPCLPTSAGGTSENDFIDGVQLGSINNTNSGSITGPSYTNYAGTYSTNLERNGNYTVTVTSGDYTPDHYAVWIDYDQDDVFEATEKLGDWQNTAIGASHAFAFTVPNTASIGTTIMRVRGVYYNTGEPNPTDPCFAYGYGETEDYGITITSPGSGPCVPTSLVGTADGDFVDGVQLGSINNTGSGGIAGPSYQDYTSQSTTLLRGDEYTLDVTSGDYTTDILGAWIDFNGNDAFETNELVGDAITASVFETQSFVFTVPTNAALGSAVMRVRCVYPDTGEPTSADPCANFTWGETEDYTVIIETNTSISSSGSSIVSYYPNPADGEMLVNMGKIVPEHVDVIDPVGRIVATLDPLSSVFHVTTNALSNGQYVLRISAGGLSHSVPFSVVHLH